MEVEMQSESETTGEFEQNDTGGVGTGGDGTGGDGTGGDGTGGDGTGGVSTGGVGTGGDGTGGDGQMEYDEYPDDNNEGYDNDLPDSCPGSRSSVSVNDCAGDETKSSSVDEDAPYSLGNNTETSLLTQDVLAKDSSKRPADGASEVPA
jgi:hypothetical protein